MKLRRSRDVFALMVDVDTYRIKIKDLALFVRNVQYFLWAVNAFRDVNPLLSVVHLS
jgi:hypothetical protein